MSVMFWAAGEEVSCSGRGQLMLGARVEGRVGQLVGSAPAFGFCSNS